MLRTQKFFILFFLFFLSSAKSFAEADDKSFYFDADGSGEGTHRGAKFPTDDEDIDEGSGNEPDLVTIDGEPEIVKPVDGGLIKKTELKPSNEEPSEKTVTGDDGTNDEVISEPGIGAVATGGIHFIAAMVVGGCIGLLFAVCVVMLLVYRMRKKDEGSYALEYGLDKKPQGAYEYTKGVDSKEYFA